MKRLLLVSILLVGLSACVTPPPLNFSIEDGMLQPAQQDEKINAELKSITVTGIFGNSHSGQVVKSSFKDSLEEAIVKSALFNDNSERTVSLVATFLKSERISMADVSLTTKITINYKLIDRKDAKVIFSKDISSTKGVPFGYSLSTRVRFSELNNRLMRQNIANLINELKKFRVKD